MVVTNHKRGEGSDIIECSDPSEIHRLFIIFLLKKDLDVASSLYHPNAVFVPGIGEEGVSGKVAIRAQLELFQEVAPAMELVSRTIYVAGDTALVNMTWKIKGTEIVHIAMDVLQKNSDGCWQFLIDNPYGA